MRSVTDKYLKVLMNLSYSDLASSILQKLSSDPAIKYVITTNCLESITAIPPNWQKLLYKGWRATHTPKTKIQDAGLINGIEVTMLGLTDQQLDTIAKVESEHQHREQVTQEHELKGTVKVCLL